MKIRPREAEIFPFGRTDRHYEATNSRFSQFCELVWSRNEIANMPHKLSLKWTETSRDFTICDDRNSCGAWRGHCKTTTEQSFLCIHPPSYTQMGLHIWYTVGSIRLYTYSANTFILSKTEQTNLQPDSPTLLLQATSHVNMVCVANNIC